MEQKKKKKLTKNRYLLGYIVVVALLFVVRLALPDEMTAVQATSSSALDEKAVGLADSDGPNVKDVGQEQGSEQDEDAGLDENTDMESEDDSCEDDGNGSEETADEDAEPGNDANSEAADGRNSGQPLLADGVRPHPILSVPSYKATFPDTNAVQLVAAQQWGVLPVKNRADAESRKKELVYVGASPYYHVAPLHQSIPYLVPRAAVLLSDIGQAFFDSLYVKGVPLHRFIVTSVLRTEEDVARLRRFNVNATEKSCHLYGTTFDICYNRYETVEDPDGPKRREVRNDTLKYVLSEVLRDMRVNNRCYIKYEVKQGCFHMTVR